MAPDGSEVVVGPHIDRRFRFCQCRECGVVERCTPSNDFFTTDSAGGGDGLLCERCFDAHLRTRFAGVIDVRIEERE